MIDYHGDLVTALKTILPTYYEMTLHSGLATPCISYMEINNYVYLLCSFSFIGTYFI